MQIVQVRLPASRQRYEIKICAGLLSSLGREARNSLGAGAGRVALVSNPTVFEIYGKRALGALRRSGFQVSSWLMKEGERYKSLRCLEQILSFLSQAGFERSDAIVALGGGVVGDLAGFAAAVYLRGVPFVQVPTTLLAQIDSSVGGKTAVNLPAGKNLVGAFHQPRLVLIDTNTLLTLPSRELTAGWCEAVKQGAIGGLRLFNQTKQSVKLSLEDKKSQTQVSGTIAAHCRFKASVVAGDERESVERKDARSRKILNFGHTTAHALEKVTNYRRFRHGEAVGYGVLVAGEISKSLGMLPFDELESLREAVRLCGPLPPADDLAPDQILKAMASDKKSVAGAPRWILLERIGEPQIVHGNDIPSRIIRSSLRTGLRPLN